MKIHYNDTYWESILSADARKMPLERHLEMVFSLLIFLQISIAKHLRFIFTSKIDEVKARSSRFMGFTPTAKDEDTKFPPGMVFRAWLKNFPDAQEHMNDVVAPFAQAIVGKESDKMIQDVQLKVKMKTLTLKGIQELLQPQQVTEKYREHAPFTWKLLYTFTAIPNKARKQMAKQRAAGGTVDGDDDWDDDPNLGDDELMKTWDTLQIPEGFTRNLMLVC